LSGSTQLQDIKTFFSRPTLVARGNLITSPGGLYNLSLSWSQMANAIPNFANRLRGVRGIRADVVFTLEHNANPFQQGLVVLGFQYGTNQFLRVTRPSMITHLPHTRLNLSENTQARLTVPYLSEFEYWGSTDSEINHSMGVFAVVQVLGTPALANSGTPVFKVYVHFENIEVIGHLPLVDAATVVPQSGIASNPKGKDVAQAELEANGQFSGVLAAAARLPTAVGRWMPSLRPFTAPTAWFLNASSRAASAFGFSKPVATAMPMRQIRYPNWGEGNLDIASPATTVGGFLGNSVALTEATGGTDVDEMAFDTILTRYSQVYRGSVSTTNSHADCVYASHVCLSHMWFRAPGVATNGGNISLPRGSATQFAVIPTTLMYFGQHFRFWHGGLKYRVTFSKSKFHTGRIQFTFIPNYRQISNTQRYVDVSAELGPVPPTFNGALQASQYTTVFDLKDTSVMEFEVPYIAPTSHLGYNDTMGFVSMQIMDPLIANGEAATTIDFIVEVAAIPGFYFAGLGSPGQPICADNVTAAIEFQSGISPSKDAAQYSVGEKYLSAKQLALVPFWAPRVNQADASVANGPVPYWHSVAAWGTGGVLAAGTTRAYAFSRSGMVAQCYAYAIGSTLVTLDRNNLTTNSRSAIQLNRADNNTATTGTVPSAYVQVATDPNSTVGLISGEAGGGQLLLPTLCSAPRYRVGDFNVTTTRDYSPTAAAGSVVSNSQTVKAFYNWLVRNSDGVTKGWHYAVAAADDARAVSYIGPCPLVLANSASATATWYPANAY
jgi:hypothetical protein